MSRTIDERTQRYNKSKQWAADQWDAIEAARAKNPHKPMKTAREDRLNAAYCASDQDPAYEQWQRSGSALNYPTWCEEQRREGLL